ncbi:hypothetical protein HDZ31DRAFT_51011, partial [Schizophyllum fasciatum]
PVERTLLATMQYSLTSTGCLLVDMNDDGTITIVDPEGNVVSITTYEDSGTK